MVVILLVVRDTRGVGGLVSDSVRRSRRLAELLQRASVIPTYVGEVVWEVVDVERIRDGWRSRRVPLISKRDLKGWRRAFELQEPA